MSNFKNLFFLSIFISMSTSACCIPEQEAVVQSAKNALKSLEDYNAEILKSIEYSRSAVQLAIATTLEKERIVHELSLLKNNTDLRADAKAVIVREILLKSTAGLGELQPRFDADLNSELNILEKGGK